MSSHKLATNVFPIENAAELETDFRLFRVRGLDSSQQEYHANRSRLELELKRAARAASVVYEDGDELLAAVHAKVDEVPRSFNLVRANIRLDDLDEVRTVSFRNSNDEDAPFCLHVLHFLIQGFLEKERDLWQPGSGKPYFPKRTLKTNGDLALYRGFAARPCRLPDGQYGVAIDGKSRIVHRQPLPTHISRQQFRRWQGSRCIYHFGDRWWYETRIQCYSDLSVSEIQIAGENGSTESLLAHILRRVGRPVPREVSELPHDASAVGYFHSSGTTRHMPAALCYPIDGTEHPDARAFEADIKPRPAARRREQLKWRNKYLSEITRDGLTVKISEQSSLVERKSFRVPDLQFGNNTILTTNRRREDATFVERREWGPKRLQLLTSSQAGFVDQEELGRQYLFVPESVMDTFGATYVDGLKKQVDKLFPQRCGYDPSLVTYNDRVARTSIEQGRQIVEKAKEACAEPGHALVVIHRTEDQPHRSEDRLAALVIRELFKEGITAAVGHTEVLHRCFEEHRSRSGKLEYRVRRNRRGLLAGYLRGLALNKVLLANERWPFALDKRLHADITIGIDVKNNTAGLILIGPQAEIIRPHCSESRRKEKLAADQLEYELCELIRAEASHLGEARRIVIHRDGRLYDEEREGINSALQSLRQEGTIATNAEAALLEIKKSAAIPLRLYGVMRRGEKTVIRNPGHGDYLILGEDGFVCNTGWPFEHRGTNAPLHVHYSEGTLPFQDCLEDIFWLSCLAFTKPDDCSRVPLSLRLIDRRLRDEASEYDEDAFRFQTRENLKGIA